MLQRSLQLLAAEPGRFAGRNIPDLSADADPDTGYFYVQGGTIYNYYGGTSFVAPQFAGTLALMVEKLGHRVLAETSASRAAFRSSDKTTLKRALCGPLLVHAQFVHLFRA